jgi:Transglutaminase-like superfamily
MRNEAFVAVRGRSIRLVSAVVLLAAGVTFGAASGAEESPRKPHANPPGFEETWQIVTVGQARVGYGRSSTETRQRDGQTIIASETEMSLAIARFGQSVKTKTIVRTEESPDGDLISFEFEMLNPPASPMRRKGRVEGNRILLENEVAGKTKRSERPFDRTVKSSAWQDRQLRENPMKPGEKRTLTIFDPQEGKPNTVTLEAGEQEEVTLPGDRKMSLLKVRINTSSTPGIVMHEYLDSRGEARMSTMSLLGLATYRVEKEEALKSLSGEEADLAIATLVKTDVISKPQQTRRVVYHLTTPGDDPVAMLSNGAAQSVESQGPHVARVIVNSIAPPETPPAGEKPPDAKYLASNSYIQSDDERIIRYAKQAVANSTDPWAAARLMERFVFQNVTKKNFSTLMASAAEVANSLSGDCTEHAVLLAAMARSQKIPARVAVGMVYVASLTSFGGHMWTEVYINGVWVPLDATLGLGGIGADHIKFTDASFSDDEKVSPLATFMPLVSVLGKVQIKVIEVEHK